jgi:hypothetical protein
MTRPANFLDWVPTGNPLYVQQPSAGQQATGWVYEESPPMEYMNWLFYTTDLWLKYFDAVLGISPTARLFIDDTTPAVTAQNSQEIFVNTTAAPVTVTLPASPTIGWKIILKDSKKTFATNNLTIARNGSNINGVASNYTGDTDGVTVELVYIDVSYGWATFVY